MTATTMKKTTKTRAMFVPLDEGQLLLGLRSTITVKATSEDTGGTMDWVLIESGPGGDVIPHRHPWGEAYYVLDGSMEVQVGASPIRRVGRRLRDDPAARGA